MTHWLLDASALLALLQREPGGEVVDGALRDGSAMSTVNLAEVAARLHRQGWPAEDVAGAFRTLEREFGLVLLPFDAEVALRSGALRPATAALGLGDRACLATAGALGVPALTADRLWLDLALPGIEVRSVR